VQAGATRIGPSLMLSKEDAVPLPADLRVSARRRGGVPDRLELEPDNASWLGVAETLRSRGDDVNGNRVYAVPGKPAAFHASTPPFNALTELKP